MRQTISDVFSIEWKFFIFSKFSKEKYFIVFARFPANALVEFFSLFQYKGLSNFSICATQILPIHWSGSIFLLFWNAETDLTI